MDTLSINYATLGLATMVKIFELADILGCTPRKAAEAYLLYSADKQQTAAA